MDQNLTNNAVDIVVNHCILSSSVTLWETDHVVLVTFVTLAQICWIEIPHPQTIVAKVIRERLVIKCTNVTSHRMCTS